MARYAQLTAELPPMRCTPELRDRIVAIADRERISIAEVQRQALSLFLTERDRESIAQTTKSHIQHREEQKR